MKKSFLGVLAIASLMSLSSCQQNQSGKELKDMKSAEDSVSYALGILQGVGFRHSLEKNEDMNEAFNSEVFAAAFKKALATENDEDLDLTNEESVKMINDFLLNTAKQKGEKFLTENKAKEGVVETESGLQYKVLSASEDANAPKPTAESYVKVDYEGKLINGDIFDSSYRRGEAALFPANRVIPGWTEGLQLMKEGDEFEFYIPSDLAYGDPGNGAIPPASTLIFKVKLHKVMTKEEGEKEEEKMRQEYEAQMKKMMEAQKAAQKK